MSRLLALAALPFAACMTGSTATGGGDLDGADRATVAPAPAIDQASASATPGADLPDRIYDPPLGVQIYAVDVKCAGQTAFVSVATAVPADELELRRVPEWKVGELGRVYQERTSYLFEPLVKAPKALGYPYLAMISLEGQTCDDFTAQLQEVRGRFGDKYESHALGPAAETQP